MNSRRLKTLVCLTTVALGVLGSCATRPAHHPAFGPLDFCASELAADNQLLNANVFRAGVNLSIHTASDVRKPKNEPPMVRNRQWLATYKVTI